MCGKKHCSIKLYHDMFSKPIDLSKFKGSDKETIRLIKKFYSKLSDCFKKLYDEHSLSDNQKARGDRTFISKRFQETLMNYIKEIVNNEALVENEKDILDSNYKDYLNKKKVDLYVNGNSEKIAIEIKTTIEFNPLGAAYFEALLTSKYDKFFVVALSTSSKNKDSYKKLRGVVKLIEKKKEKRNEKTITDLVVFDPELNDFEKGVMTFFDAIRKACI